MGVGWNPFGFHFVALILLLLIWGSLTLNDEGLILLKFREKVWSDPFGAFNDWNPMDNDPCLWSHVRCVAGKVERLDFNELQLEGTLSPELGKLIHLKSLVLRKNCFSGTIPEEIGELKMLELLDLRDNNFSGTVPVKILRLPSLKCLLLCHNKFEGKSSVKIAGRLNVYSDLQFNKRLACGASPSIACISRKFGNGFKLGTDSTPECEKFPSSAELDIFQNVEIIVNSVRRRLFEQSSNLAAPPAGGSSSPQIISLAASQSSGSFPAIPTGKNSLTPPVTKSSPGESATGKIVPQSSSTEISEHKWIYFLIIPVAFSMVIVSIGLLVIVRKQGVTTIGPWKTGLSGQLQKAFVTGVPKLNKGEVETACEDFSNILHTSEGSIIYKGTLSSGVEIAVASTLVASSKDWSKNAEVSYRKKIDTLSRINHKNFVNLIGFLEENEPFSRMMVFEYAPNGSLFEHLHVKEMEHLDWSMRMRIIMGIAYCLKYMHHDLNPPIPHSGLTSKNVYLTDDYAAKIGENVFARPPRPSKKISGDSESEHSVLPPLADPDTNVYSFGVLLLEIISGKLSYTKEEGPLEKLASEYLNDSRAISYMIDPTLTSFKNNEMDVICEVIQECIQPDPRKRPTMKDIASKLKDVSGISPDQATPRLSPLWWAELEILSQEAT
ncbi:Leucine-rich repeat protein kinase family protein [Euphorbia peplus]|nr:Leucine-rich repeat protein kinase family protein [Euphorbia peplus]